MNEVKYVDMLVILFRITNLCLRDRRQHLRNTDVTCAPLPVSIWGMRGDGRVHALHIKLLYKTVILQRNGCSL